MWLSRGIVRTVRVLPAAVLAVGMVAVGTDSTDSSQAFPTSAPAASKRVQATTPNRTKQLVFSKGRFYVRWTPGLQRRPARILSTPQMSATDITSAGRRVYWLNRDQHTFERSIRRVSTTGNHPNSLIRKVGAAAGPLAASRRHLYWQAAGGGAISRIAMDGSPLQRRWLTGIRRQSGGSIVEGLATRGRFLYLSQCFRGRIGRVPLSAPRRLREVEWIVRGIDTCPTQLAFAGSFVYWAGDTLNGAGVIGRAPLNGGAPDDTWTRVRSSTGPLSVEVINGFIYWDWGGTPDGAQSFLGRVSVDGSKLTRKFRRIGPWPITTVLR